MPKKLGCFLLFSLHFLPNTHLTLSACLFSCLTWCYNEYKHGCALLCCTETWSPFPLTLTCCKPSTSSEILLCYTLLLQRSGEEETQESMFILPEGLLDSLPQCYSIQKPQSIQLHWLSTTVHFGGIAFLLQTATAHLHSRAAGRLDKMSSAEQMARSAGG